MSNVFDSLLAINAIGHPLPVEIEDMVMQYLVLDHWL